MDVDLFLCIFPEKDWTFEVYRNLQPHWLMHSSVYFMDHDSEGKCYCKWLLPLRPESV